MLKRVVLGSCAEMLSLPRLPSQAQHRSRKKAGNRRQFDAWAQKTLSNSDIEHHRVPCTYNPGTHVLSLHHADVRWSCPCHPGTRYHPRSTPFHSCTLDSLIPLRIKPSHTCRMPQHATCEIPETLCTGPRSLALGTPRGHVLRRSWTLHILWHPKDKSYHIPILEIRVLARLSELICEDPTILILSCGVRPGGGEHGVGMGLRLQCRLHPLEEATGIDTLGEYNIEDEVRGHHALECVLRQDRQR